MKQITHLIAIPQQNQKKAEAFQDIFTNLHEGIQGKTIALEIIALGQNIGFCFTTDPSTAEIIAGQIYASMPEADITEIPDFTKSLKEGTCLLGCEISLERNDLFPIKTYEQFESDSLSGVLNVMSKVKPEEGVWIQLIIQAVPDTGLHHFRMGWQKRFDKVRQMFRMKYWFKKGVAETFEGKMQEKMSSRTFKAGFRIAAIGKEKTSAESRLKALIGALQNFNTLDLNKLKPGKITPLNATHKNNFSERSLNNGFLLSTRELASLYHLPNENEVPNLVHVLSRKAEPPADLPVDKKNPEISFFGMTNFHGKAIPFGMYREDRRRHLYTVGKSGSGKSKLLELLIQNDIEAGKGVGVLDPHGDLVDNVLRMIPEHRIKDVVIFDPSDTEHPITFNPLADVPPKLKMRVTIGFIEIFKKLFGANWTPRLEHVLRYTTLALLDTPGTTIFSILKMLTDKNYRQMIVRNIKESNVKNFWVNEFAGWSEKFDNEAITPLLNKVGQFVATDMIRNIVAQPENKVDFRGIMDNQKILLMKVSKGILGEENAALLGSIAITKIYQAAMSRADTKEDERVDFYFYVDEFQNFATDTFDEILSEARKYRLNLTIAHQFLGQLSSKIRTTVFGNVGSMISFRVGGEDAKILAEEYNPRFSERDIINLGVRDFYTKLSVKGELREAFSGKTLKVNYPEKDHSQACLDYSRAQYTNEVAGVEAALKNWEENAGKTPTSSSPTAGIQEEEAFEEPLI